MTSVQEVGDGDVALTIGPDYPELRDAVRRVCAHYPGEYWRKLDDVRGYPTDSSRR